DARDRTDHHWGGPKSLSERYGRKRLAWGLARCQTTGFDPDACPEDVRATLHSQIADGLRGVAAIEIVRFLDADLKAGGVHMADADGRRGEVVGAQRCSHHDGIAKRLAKGDAFPHGIYRQVTSFQEGRRDRKRVRLGRGIAATGASHG